jgi:hypothetical protein
MEESQSKKQKAKSQDEQVTAEAKDEINPRTLLPFSLKSTDSSIEIVITKVGRLQESVKVFAGLKFDNRYGTFSPYYKLLEPKEGFIFIKLYGEINNLTSNKVKFKGKDLILRDSSNSILEVLNKLASSEKDDIQVNGFIPISDIDLDANSKRPEEFIVIIKETEKIISLQFSNGQPAYLDIAKSESKESVKHKP